MLILAALGTATQFPYKCFMIIVTIRRNKKKPIIFSLLYSS